MNEEAKKYFSQGINCINLKRYERAIACFDKAIDIDLEAEFYMYRGIAKLNLKQYEEAIKDFDEAIDIGPKYPKAYYNRGDAKQELGQYEEAIKDYSKAIETNSRYSEAYVNRSIAKINLGQYKEAVKDCSKAIKINPKDYKAYMNRGNAKLGLKQYEEAIDDYNEAIEINPKFAEAYYNRGVAKKELGQQKEAEKDFQKANQLNPKLFIDKETEELREETQKIGKETQKARDFQKILEEATKQFKKTSKWWLITLGLFSTVVVVVLIAWICLKDVNQFDFSKISLSVFLITLNFFVMRQYTNAKRLYLETNNRLIASKLFESVKQDKNNTVKEISYKKLIGAIVSSPYNQQNYKNDGGDLEGSLSRLIEKLKK